MSNFVGDNDHGDRVPDYNMIMDEHVSKVYKLEQERDEARRIACYQYAKKYTHVERVAIIGSGPAGSQEQKLMSGFAEMHGWDIPPQPFDEATEDAIEKIHQCRRHTNQQELDALSKLDQELGL